MPLEPNVRTGTAVPNMSAPHTKTASGQADPSSPTEPLPPVGAAAETASQADSPARNLARADRWAIGLSALCLVHCLSIPVALLLFPVVAHNLIDHQSWVHWALLALALPLSAYALLTGYRRHRYRPVLILGGIGISLMFIGVGHLAGLQWELPLTVAGAALLAYAHVENMRRSHA